MSESPCYCSGFNDLNRRRLPPQRCFCKYQILLCSCLPCATPLKLNFLYRWTEILTIENREQGSFAAPPSNSPKCAAGRVAGRRSISEENAAIYYYQLYSKAVLVAARCSFASYLFVLLGKSR